MSPSSPSLAVGSAVLTNFLLPSQNTARVITYCAVATCVVLAPNVGVGATGVPVNVGDAVSAFKLTFAVSAAVCAVLTLSSLVDNVLILVFAPVTLALIVVITTIINLA